MEYTYADAYNNDVGNRFYDQIDAIRKTLSEAYVPTESWWSERIAMIIAHVDEEVKGFCAFYREGTDENVAICKLVVPRGASQEKTERQLIKEVFVFAKARGYPGVDVGADASSEQIPSPYHGLGFEIDYIGLSMKI